MSSRSLRALALCGVLVLTASYVHLLGEVTAVVGTTAPLYGVVAGTVVAATVLARTVGERSATAGAALVGAVCGTYYFAATGEGPGVVVSATGTVLADTLALATGVSILRVSEVGIWALAFVPAPVFLSWYLALRRRYALAVLPGGAALVFLVLTGDATVGTTAVGVTGALAAVGFGELEVREGTIAQADVLAVVFAAALVLSTTVAVVPAGSSGPVMVADDGGPSRDRPPPHPIGPRSPARSTSPRRSALPSTATGDRTGGPASTTALPARSGSGRAVTAPTRTTSIGHPGATTSSLTPSLSRDQRTPCPSPPSRSASRARSPRTPE